MRGTRLDPPLSPGRRRTCLIHGAVVIGLSLLGVIAIGLLTATRALACSGSEIVSVLGGLITQRWGVRMVL